MGQHSQHADELASRAARGDRAAMNQLIDQHRSKLRRMISIRLSPRIAQRVDASDIVQEAMADAAQRIQDFAAQPNVSFYPWLRRLAWQRLIKVHRYHITVSRRSVDREDRVRLELSEDSMVDLANCVAGNASSPSKRMIRHEVRAKVQDSLEAMRPKDREVLVLRYLEQLSMREISEILEITEDSVKKRHARALHRMQQLLDSGSRGTP